MTVEKEFIKLVKSKYEGKNYDFLEYIKKIDGFIFSAYKRVQHYSTDKTTVEFEEIQTRCWDKLEDDTFQNKINDLSFINDNCFYSFLIKIFEHLIIDFVSDKTPGLKSRLKQTARVLKPICNELDKKEKKCWKLKAFKTSDQRMTTDMNAIEIETKNLLNSAKNIRLPDIKYPKTKDSKRGASIKDEDMKKYLVAILEGVGGCTVVRAMNKFITIQFGLYSVNQININGYDQNSDEADTTEEQLSALKYKSGFIQANIMHKAMAYEIFKGLKLDTVKVIYYRYIDNMKMKDVAKIMGKSLGTISNMENSFREYMQNYITDSGNELDYEEVKYILDFLKTLIEEDFLKLGLTK